MNSSSYFIDNKDTLEFLIASRLRFTFSEENIPNDAWENDTWWTNKVKSLLVDIGRKQKYMVACAGVESDHGEWKYDLTWWEESNEDGRYRLTNIPLVAESEWNLRLDAIQYDFEKLIVARADRRLMVFNVVQPADALNHVDWLKTIVKTYKWSQVCDRYMFAVWIQSTKEFYFDSYVHSN